MHLSIPSYSTRAVVFLLLTVVLFLASIKKSTAFFRYARSLSHRRYQLLSMREAPILGEIDVKIASLNVLAPCYNRNEAFDETTYLHRHENICHKLKDLKADVICIQEYWLSSEKLQRYAFYLRLHFDILFYTIKLTEFTINIYAKKLGIP